MTNDQIARFLQTYNLNDQTARFLKNYSLKTGLKQFGDFGKVAKYKEMKQLHGREVLTPT